MATIALQGLEFHAHHGVYAHERESGNKFSVDISVKSSLNESAFSDELDGTLNYEELYAIVKQEMEQPAKLMETVAHRIIHQVFNSISSAETVTVKISKFNPPIGGTCERASVTLSKSK
jgi:7,8-dihydroneopterin aldolase/epimerase/oxygenase